MLVEFQRTEFERRIDEVVDAFEESWARDSASDVRQFLPSEITNFEDLSIAVELLRVDLQYRWKNGDPKTAEQYRAEFPEILSDDDQYDKLRFEEFRAAGLYADDAVAETVAENHGIDTRRWSYQPNGERSPSALVDFAEDQLQRLRAWDQFPQAGETIAEFELIKELGRGAFAVVYLAEQPSLANREVVLKVTLGHTIEPAKLARLQHSNIVPIHSVHEHGPWQIICMPYLGSATLHDLMQDELFLAYASDSAANESLRVAQQIVAGLQHAHSKGIVHRDVKPANVLVSDDGTVLLMDFNLSDNIVSGGRVCAFVGGTLPYLAPEHLRSITDGTPVGPQADIFSLGVMLYEMLSGKPPFPQRTGQFDDVVEQMILDRQSGFTPLHRLNPRIPRSVSAMVSRMLAPHLGDRYQNADELAEDLDRHFHDLPLRHARETSWQERFAKFRRRHPRLMSGSTVAGVSALLIGLLLFSLMSLQGRLATARAIEIQNRLSSTMPVLRSVLSTPTVEKASMEEAQQMAQAAVSAYATDYGSWRNAPSVAPLEEPRKLQLGRDLSDVYYLLARQSIHLASTTPEGSERAKQLEQAKSWNERAQSIAKSTDLPLDLLRVQEQQIAALERGESVKGVTAPSMKEDVASWQSAFWLLENGQFEDAQSVLTALRDDNPHDPSAWLLLGNAYAGAGQLEDARHCYEVAVAMWPKSHIARYYHGLASYDLNDFETAEADFSACLKLKPNYIPAWISRAATREHMHRYEEAEHDITQAIDLGASQTRLYFIRSRLRSRRGDRQGAAEDFRRGQRLEPSDELSWVERGLSFAKEDPQRALADFDRALQQNPRSRHALRNKAYVLGERLGELDQACDLLNQLISFYGHPDDMISLAVYRGRQGKHNEALALANDVLRVSPSSKQLFQAACVYSLTAQNQSDKEKAIAVLEQAITADPEWIRFAEVDPDLANIRTLKLFRSVVQSAKDRVRRWSTTSETSTEETIR